MIRKKRKTRHHEGCGLRRVGANAASWSIPSGWCSSPSSTPPRSRTATTSAWCSAPCASYSPESRPCSPTRPMPAQGGDTSRDVKSRSSSDPKAPQASPCFRAAGSPGAALSGPAATGASPRSSKSGSTTPPPISRSLWSSY